VKVDVRVGPGVVRVAADVGVAPTVMTLVVWRFHICQTLWVPKVALPFG
jgi:hypothetical protein